MLTTKTTPSSTEDLPENVKTLFWDYDADTLDWATDWELITARILASGPWDAVQWLRDRLGDASLRDWITERRGRGLSPRQLRFWELILELPHREVNAWLSEQSKDPWHRRTSR